MVNLKIFKLFSPEKNQYKKIFLIFSSISSLFIITFSDLAISSELKNNSEKTLNQRIIGRARNKNYLIRSKAGSSLEPIISGDIETNSQLFKTQGYVKIKGPKVNLTVKDADAKDLLLTLSNLGKYGLVFVPSSAENTTNKKVTLSLQNAEYEKALNSVLLASSLQGKFDNGILIIGENILDKSFGPNISKVYRLNQISSNSAAEYLGSLGATINILSLKSSINSETNNKVVNQATKKPKIESYVSS